MWLLPAAGTLTLSPASAAAQGAPAPATYYVDGASTGGPCSDSYTAAQAQNPRSPWCTITAAVATVPTGAVVAVEPGIYHEAVTLTPKDNYVTLQAAGTTRPIIDGDATRNAGIVLTGGVHDVTVNGFEIRNMTAPSQGRASGIISYNTSSDVIQNNVIHAIHDSGPWSYGIVLGWNNSPGLVHDVTVKNNRIYDIGPGGESMGIWLLMTKNMTVDGNEIYLVRKEGIRDWFGLNNSFVSNRLYLNWVGLTLESAIGDYVANNVSYANVWGYNPKHVSEPSALNIWGLSTGQWSRFWHNTSYGNTHADIALGMNAPNADYIDVRDNVLASASDVHLHDFPWDRGSHILVDGNVYSGATPISYAGWNAQHAPVYNTLSDVQTALGWETHGQSFTPQFRSPGTGHFGFSAAGMAPGIALPDAYGAQLGAANVPAASMAWTRYPTTVTASTPEPLFLANAAQRAGDGSDDTYWWSSNYNTNASVTFDLGAPQPMNTFVLDLFSHMDPRNPQGYSILVSNDNTNYTTVSSGVNPDSEGSSYKYTLSSPVTARYVRLNLLTSFGGSTVLFSDFGIGLVAPTGSAPPPTPVVPLRPAHPRSPSAPHRRSARAHVHRQSHLRQHHLRQHHLRHKPRHRTRP